MDNDVLDGAGTTTTTNGSGESTTAPAVPDLTEQLRDVLGPTISTIGSSLQALEDKQNAINDRLDGLGGSNTPDTPDPSDDSEFNKLYADPNKYLAGVMNEVLEKRGDGGTAIALEQLGRNNLAENEKRIDDTYGNGTWKEKILPMIEHPLGEMKPSIKADAGSLRTLVDAALGQETVRDDLVQRRTEMLNRKPTPPSLPGGGIPSAGEPKERLTDVERQFANSVGVDEGTFLGLRNASASGSVTLDEYMKISGKEQ